MARRLPPLVALRAFEAVGRLGSVRAAGDELAVSHTVVSRHVRNLEQRIGTRLLRPAGRGLALTPEGARFLGQVAQALDLIEHATAELSAPRRRTLAIWCAPGVASRRVLPKLPELEALLPEQEITLLPTLARPDFARAGLGPDGADAEIIYLEASEPRDGVRAELLSSPRVFPVASSAFRARYADVTAPADLLRLPLIHEESTEQWERWLHQAGVAEVPALRGPRLWHAHLAIEAARLGQGVALANAVLAGEDLATGALVEVVPSDIRLGGYYFLSATARWQDPDLATLRQWLRALFATQPSNGA
jgi:DNA-binding transcriptional LysR family regulator